MTDQRGVNAAESAVAARKAIVASQWAALHSGLLDRVTAPSTLGVVALAGGIIGWRSGARDKPVEVTCTCAAPPRPSLMSNGVRALALATLQAVASIASEEFIRGAMGRAPVDGSTDDAKVDS